MTDRSRVSIAIFRWLFAPSTFIGISLVLAMATYRYAYHPYFIRRWPWYGWFGLLWILAVSLFSGLLCLVTGWRSWTFSKYRVAGVLLVLVLSISSVAWLFAYNPHRLHDVAAGELEQLQGELTLTNYGWLEANIHNGTDKHVAEITVEIAVFMTENLPANRSEYVPPLPPGYKLDKPAPANVPHNATIGDKEQPIDLDLRSGLVPKLAFVRRYRLTTTNGEPLADSQFIGEVNFKLAPGQQWNWKLIRAKGYREH